MAYASGTSVTPEKSQADIQRTLMRYGADGFGVFQRAGMASVGFEFKGLSIRIDVTLPDMNDKKYQQTGNGRSRKLESMRNAWEQDVRCRWRALLLAIKAKLEAVEVGISTIETEFMPFVVMPDGSTLGSKLLPRLLEVAKSGKMPKLLPGGNSNE